MQPWRCTFCPIKRALGLPTTFDSFPRTCQPLELSAKLEEEEGLASLPEENLEPFLEVEARSEEASLPLILVQAEEAEEVEARHQAEDLPQVEVETEEVEARLWAEDLPQEEEAIPEVKACSVAEDLPLRPSIGKLTGS